jgi:glycine dehydrogenase subunit 2
MKTIEPSIFEKSIKGYRAISFTNKPLSELPIVHLPESLARKEKADLPEVSELKIVRHYTRLSQLNFSIDTHFYPLGSCTMKYNPKINDRMASLPGFSQIHPHQWESSTQGCLDLLFNLDQALCEICGMDAFTLQPAAGAHGEFTGLLIIKKYLEDQKQTQRNEVIVPDSAHGTNPASAVIAGFKVITIPSLSNGEVNLEELQKALSSKTAALMLTNPNTTGVFESKILEVSKMVHDAGALLYYDGANLNAMVGIARPGDMGFDVIHLNLHKTFSTPHGGGGPGAGPVGVKSFLQSYLPYPCIKKNEDGYFIEKDHASSIGKVRSFYGNFGVLVRAYTYIRAHGLAGLKRIAKGAIVNANYLKAKLKDTYEMYSEQPCSHEFLIIPNQQMKNQITVADIAKRLLDYGFHAPTISWPVRNCLMIEPTETESIDTLDRFIEAMKSISQECEQNPELVRTAPHNLPVKRLDEVKAARELNLQYKPNR